MFQQSWRKEGWGANCLFLTIQRMLKPFARTFSFQLILSNLSNQPTSALGHFKAKRTYKYKHRLHFLVYFKRFPTNSLSSFLLFFDDHARKRWYLFVEFYTIYLHLKAAFISFRYLSVQYDGSVYTVRRPWLGANYSPIFLSQTDLFSNWISRKWTPKGARWPIIRKQLDFIVSPSQNFFCFLRKGSLKIDRSVKMLWHRKILVLL